MASKARWLATLVFGCSVLASTGAVAHPDRVTSPRAAVQRAVARVARVARSVRTMRPRSRVPRVPMIGARYDHRADATRFRVWANDHARVALEIHHPDGHVESTPMTPGRGGFFKATMAGVRPGARYKFRLDDDGEALPDPTSRSQPDGVDGASEVVDPHFAWTDRAWRGIDLHDLNRGGIYEMHVGTFTRQGTLDAAIGHLDHLRGAGIGTVELMPLATASGNRGWGYDGVNQFAPLAAYGGPDAVRRFVDAAHARGIGVVVDVVYNHQGPQGDHTGRFSRAYRNASIRTPWGDAPDFAATAVRQNVLANVEMWVRDMHVDGLRLDAAHEIHDEHGQPHILTAIARTARAAAGGRRVVVTAEDDRNWNGLVTPEARGGMGLDAVWVDDFHHEVRVGLGQERVSYYGNFTGSARDLAKTLNGGWFFHGQSQPTSGRPRGTSSKGVDRAAMIYTIGNHDQYGNRAQGDRLRTHVSAAEFRAARSVMYGSPGTPLLFQGDEWGTRTPFQYFTDHPRDFGRLVTEGRTHEFAAFGFDAADVPDPQARSTFENSKLRWSEVREPEHQEMLGTLREDSAMHARLVTTATYVRARAIGAHAVEQTWRGHDGSITRLLVNLRDGEPVEVHVPAGLRVVRARDGASLGTDGIARLPGAGMLELVDR